MSLGVSCGVQISSPFYHLVLSKKQTTKTKQTIEFTFILDVRESFWWIPRDVLVLRGLWNRIKLDTACGDSWCLACLFYISVFLSQICGFTPQGNVLIFPIYLVPERCFGSNHVTINFLEILLDESASNLPKVRLVKLTLHTYYRCGEEIWILRWMAFKRDLPSVKIEAHVSPILNLVCCWG